MLRRKEAPDGRPDGMLVVVGDHFLYVSDRPTPLPPASPGEGGHPPDRGTLQVSLDNPYSEWAWA